MAQELQQEDSCQSSLTEIRYVFVCCAQPGSEIAHDLEQYSGAAHVLAKAAVREATGGSLLGDLADRGGGTGGALRGGVSVDVVCSLFRKEGAALTRAAN